MTEDQKLFLSEDADRRKCRAGKPYEPSNGSEGSIFMSRWCWHCTKNQNENKECDILTRATWVPVGETGYPTEWTWSDEGQPQCTAFERRQ